MIKKLINIIIWPFRFIFYDSVIWYGRVIDRLKEPYRFLFVIGVLIALPLFLLPTAHWQMLYLICIIMWRGPYIYYRHMLRKITGVL